MPTPATQDRSRMEEHIRSGGSVLLRDGRIVTRAEDLPAEAEMAAGDRNRLEAERDRIQAVVDDHQRQLKTVNDRLAALPQPPAPKAAAKSGGAGAEK